MKHGDVIVSHKTTFPVKGMEMVLCVMHLLQRSQAIYKINLITRKCIKLENCTELPLLLFVAEVLGNYTGRKATFVLSQRNAFKDMHLSPLLAFYLCLS